MNGIFWFCQELPGLMYLCNSIHNVMLRALQVAAITLTGDAVQI